MEYLADQRIESIEDGQRAVRKLLETGPLLVILTLGAKGVLYAHKRGDSGHVTVPTVEVAETTVKTICTKHNLPERPLSSYSTFFTSPKDLRKTIERLFYRALETVFAVHSRIFSLRDLNWS